MNEVKKAIVLTWEIKEQTTFWNNYESHFYPTIKSLYVKELIENVFPFEHKPLSHPDKAGHWTNCVIMMLPNEEYNPDIHSNIISAIEKSSLEKNFRSLDLMKMQKGLDMFYPHKNGIERELKLNQTIEYVFSKLEAREKYYEDQYRFSGPAMRDLHSRDKAGRFVGFELEKRLFGAQNMPQWDVIHIIGFTTWQNIKAIPFFFSTWNKHAERAYGKGMTFKKKVAEWNSIRTNIKSSTKQNFSMTLRKTQAQDRYQQLKK